MLKYRLLFTLCLSLVLPWSGCEYIHQKELLMRSAESDRLQQQATALAEKIKPLLSQPRTAVPGSRTVNGLYLYTLPDTILLDGYADDWSIRIEPHMIYPDQLVQDFDVPAQAVTAMAGQNRHHMFMFFQIQDPGKLYANPRSFDQPSDHLLIELKHHSIAGRYLIRVSAPGQFLALLDQRHNTDSPDWIVNDQIQGYWQDTASGYNIELQLPLAEADSELGFSLYDFDPVIAMQNPDESEIRPQDTPEFVLTAQYSNTHQSQTTAPLIQPRADLQEVLESTKQKTRRIHIIDPEGWVLAHKYHLPKSAPIKDLSSLNQALFEILSQVYLFISNLRDPPQPALIAAVGRLQGPNIETAARGMISSHWYKRPDSNQAVMSIAYPVKHASKVLAIIILEQNSSAFLSLRNPDFLRNIAYSLLAIVILSLLMFIYTWRLALQIFRQSTKASTPAL